MRIRRAALGLHSETRAVVADGHIEDGIRAGICRTRGSEILHLQAGIPQPPHLLHKHMSIISTGGILWETLMIVSLAHAGCPASSAVSLQQVLGRRRNDERPARAFRVRNS